VIDFETLKEEVSVEEVLVYLGAKIGWRGGWGEWSPIDCPFCSDTNGSGSMNRQAGRYLCHQCGAPADGRSGDIIDIAKFELNDDNTQKAVEWLKTTFLS